MSAPHRLLKDEGFRAACHARCPLHHIRGGPCLSCCRVPSLLWQPWGLAIRGGGAGTAAVVAEIGGRGHRGNLML